MVSRWVKVAEEPLPKEEGFTTKPRPTHYTRQFYQELPDLVRRLLDLPLMWLHGFRHR
jgi:hypothetical protein